MWGRFDDYPEGRLPLAPVRKRVAVIGGGPAGIETVKRLLERGHDVTLYEQSDRIGGRIKDACGAPFKNDLRDYLKYMQEYAENCGARVLLNTKAEPEMLAAEGYDEVVVAIGAVPVMPSFSGTADIPVYWAPDAENGRVPCGENVVIVGGNSVGTEASITLAMEGKQVTVVEMAEQIEFRNGAAWDLENLSRENGVTRLLGWKVVDITKDGVTVEHGTDRERRLIPADTVLMAVGMKAQMKEAMAFAHVCAETSVHIIGDAYCSGDIRDAVYHAFETARFI
jgi:NADPH-dependent 2,4-dienoyl-CoA reductase/sulfur reductase-like enzyme